MVPRHNLSPLTGIAYLPKACAHCPPSGHSLAFGSIR
jgi:hypothetical protein